MTIRLSRRARRDLDEIREHTVEAWGREQRLRYFRSLAAGLKAIAANPLIGRDRSLFGPGMRSQPCGAHLIFFAPLEAAGCAPVILRIGRRKRTLPALSCHDDLDGA